MYKEILTLGVAPTKRSFLSMEEAQRQKDRFMKVVRSVKPEAVRIVDLEDTCENGILWNAADVPQAVEKFRAAKIDALFIPFCDFGEEQAVAGVASACKVPVLIWGARDEKPNTDEIRGRDTQCGMFAATKVLRRCGVKYSYIYNCETESPEFAAGYERFLRVAAVLKSIRNLKIAVVGQRPGPFMSVMTNEADLLTKFGVQTIPISPESLARAAKQMIEENDPAFLEYYKDITSRMNCDGTPEPLAKNAAALKMAMQHALERSGCSAAAMECWSAFPGLLGVSPCMALGELSDLGMPVSCETDLNGTVTMAILRACALYEQATFLADLTIRHPENDNAELLWHCGPFPYSLKANDSNARLVDGMGRFELRQGEMTVCRFDDIDGKYTLFAGEGKTTTGPETTGTYVWLEVDDWKRWEEKLMFGPYIHHVGCVYGNHLPVLREVARYLDIAFDSAEEQGIHSL
jgi:L-fucose isomerase and related proteins